MADPWSGDPPSAEAEREARHATDALLARIAAHRRHARRRTRMRTFGTDLAVAVATYAGLTIAAILGAIGGIRKLIGLLWN